MKIIYKVISKPKIASLFFILFMSFGAITNGVLFIYSDGYGSYHISNCLINELNWVCKSKTIYYPDYTEHTVSKFAIQKKDETEKEIVSIT